MARRAQQGAVARCPYCEAFLPQVAAECPQCRFPLTMAAADDGSRTPERSGTTSTATPGGRSTASLVTGHAAAGRDRVHGSRAHRIRITAWLLGVTSVLMLLAGVGALYSAASPDAAGDRQATISLLGALSQAAVTPAHRAEGAVPTVVATEASDGPLQVSSDQANGVWFGTSRSTSGKCFFLAGRLSDGVLVGRGTLHKDDPCTGAEIRRRFEEADAAARAKADAKARAKG